MADKKKGFDSIFESTANGKTRRAAKAAANDKNGKPAPAEPRALELNPLEVLKTAWKTHENEVLYRKAKEDKILFFSVGAMVAVVFGAAIVLGQAQAWWWISRLVFRLVFCGVAFGFAFGSGSLIELNRKRMQDLLAMTVKIQETLGLYEEGAIPGNDGAYYPNSYKFVGSMNDDETNYAHLVLKVGAAGAIFVILLLA
jgi:hypothetical protein